MLQRRIEKSKDYEKYKHIMVRGILSGEIAWGGAGGTPEGRVGLSFGKIR